MRDYLIIAFVFSMLPLCFLRPHVGALMWVWISLMNPHRLTWGLAYGFPFAQFVAITTLAGAFFTRDRSRLPMERETWLILLLGLDFTVTTLLALVPQDAWTEWNRVFKIYLMTLVPLVLLQRRIWLRQFLLVVTFSIAFFSVKAGLFSILTGGQYTIFGPPSTFITDNNALALAELMVLPLMFYLSRTEPRKWIRLALIVSAPLTIVSIIFSYSRGALIGLASLLAVYFANSRRWAYGILFVMIGVIFLAFIPSKWFERMGTIGTYQSDPSAMGRINAWEFAINVAKERPLIGGGFHVFNKKLFMRYAPNPYDPHDAHSIYFEVLGEHGFVGLALFLALLVSCFQSTRQVHRWTKSDPSLAWANDYATALRLCVLGYVVGGAFLGLAYFDLFYDLVLAIILLKTLVRKELASAAADTSIVPIPAAAAGS